LAVRYQTGSLLFKELGFMNFWRNKWNFEFVKHRNKFFIGSLILLIIGVFCLFAFGLNLGIDFSSGSRVEIYSGQKINMEEVRTDFRSIGFNPDEITYAGNQEITVAKFIGVLSTGEIAKLKTYFNEKYTAELSVSTVSPEVGIDLAMNALIATSIASLGIFIYMTIRFEWLQGLTTVVSLLHDVFCMTVVFSILQIEMNITIIAALLAIIGYSVNDTIVTFDRIRENMHSESKTEKIQNIGCIVNLSLNQTLSRSINTAITTMLAVIALLMFGGEAIRTFSLVLLTGVISGTYSSIFISSQLWAVLKEKTIRRPHLDNLK
jgi:preprotein translocase subunit SecF